MKKILIILVIMLLNLPAMSKTLTGGVVYTVESARKAAFEGIEYEISMEPFKKYLKDPGYISPAKKDGGRPKVSRRGRYVTFFSDGYYSVFYKDEINYSYFYDNEGNLEFIGVKSKNSKTYPILGKKYDTNGKLTRVLFDVSRDESFVYSPDKKLLGHWIGEKYYNANGENKYIRKFNY